MKYGIVTETDSKAQRLNTDNAPRGLNHIYNMNSLLLHLLVVIYAFCLPRKHVGSSFQRPIRSRSSFLSRSNVATPKWSQREEKPSIDDPEYMKGFVSRPIGQEPTDRVTGDKILGPTIRLAGGVTAVLVVLTLIFLVSNDIISI